MPDPGGGGGGGGGNNAPAATGDSYDVWYDTLDTSAQSQVSVLDNDYDADFDPLTAVLVTSTSDGTLSLGSNGHFTYSPDTGFTGTDSFTYQAYDGTDYSSTTTVSLTVETALSAATNLDDRPAAAPTNLESLFVSRQTGAVIVTHPIAGGLSLIYDSSTDPAPVIAVESDYSEASGSTNSPASIDAQLTVGTISGTSVHYSASGLLDTDRIRLTHQVDAGTLSTGRYSYELETTVNFTSGSLTSSRDFSGHTHLVNRNDSNFGDNWSLSALDRLFIETSGALLVDGTNVASSFEDNSGTFDSPVGPLAHSTLVENMDGSFTLTDKLGNKSEFDSDGLLTEKLDRNGNSTTFDYIDADSDTVVDELETVTDPWGNETTFAYTSGLLSSVTDFAGRVFTVGHDTSGRLTSIVQPDPDGTGPLLAPSTAYTYASSSSQLTGIDDPLSRNTAITFDFAGRFDDATYEDTNDVSIVNDQARGLVDLSTGDGTTSNPASLFYPDGSIMSQALNGASTDALGNTSLFRMDRFGFVTAWEDALGNLTTIERNNNGQPTKQTDPDPTGPATSPVTEYTYDSSGNLTEIEFPDATTQTFVYNSSNCLTSSTDELRRQTTFAVDSNGNILSVTDPLGNVTTYTYNSSGQVTNVTLADPDGTGPLLAPDTDYSYDVDGRLTQVTNPDATTVDYTWDTSNRITSVSDELGRETSFTYDNLDRILTITLPDPDGTGSLTAPVTTFTYDAFGNLITETDALSNVTTYEFDDRNNLVKVTQPDPDGVGSLTSPVLEWTYDAARRLTAATDALGHDTTYGYDVLGRRTSVTLPDPDGAGSLAAPVFSYDFDELGRMIEATDPLGNETTFEYDSRGRLTKRTDADPDGAGTLTSPVTQWDYDNAGQVTKITDPLGRETSYGYDDNGNVTGVTLPDPDGTGSLTAPVYSSTYDNLNRLLTSTDPLSNVTSYSYDVNSRLISQTDPDPDGAGSLSAPVQEWDYDDAGQLVTYTNAVGHDTTYEYDDLGRLTKTTMPDPDGTGTQLAAEYSSTYDAVGNVLSRIDALGNTTSYEYDNLYRLKTSTDAELGETDFAYDAAGNITSLIDPENNETTWTYDNLQRMTVETNELSDSRTRSYDAAGNVTSIVDRNGREREFDYDALNRLTTEEWIASSAVIHTIDYTYDAASQLTKVADDVSEYDYTYDDLGRLTEIDNDATPDMPKVILAMAYDAASRRTSLSAEVAGTDDFLNSYSYDNLGRPTQLDQAGQTGGNSVSAKRVDFGYNAIGQFTEIERFADLAGTLDVATSTYTYDDASRITDLDHSHGSTLLADYSWTWDVGGRLTSVTSVDGTDDYTYDDTSQLTDVDSDYQTDESYTYDGTGNRTNTGYTTGANNQLTSDGTYNYEYDDEGNRTKKTTISSGDYVEYDWDHRNRLTTVTFRTSTGTKTKEVSYVYDAFDRRIAKDVDANGNGTIDSGERYVYDASEFQAGIGGALVDPTRAFGWVDDIVLVFDESGTLVERLLHGPQVDQVLASEDASGDVQWFLGDHLGTIRDVVEYDSGTDSTTVVNHLQYSSFGQITSQTSSVNEPRYAFTGREWDADADLYYYRARWYDPTVGRFISEDPIGFAAGDVNVSRYVGNTATTEVDPTGLEDWVWPWDPSASWNPIDTAETWGGMVSDGILTGDISASPEISEAAAVTFVDAMPRPAIHGNGTFTFPFVPGAGTVLQIGPTGGSELIWNWVDLTFDAYTYTGVVVSGGVGTEVSASGTLGLALVFELPSSGPPKDYQGFFVGPGATINPGGVGVAGGIAVSPTDPSGPWAANVGINLGTPGVSGSVSLTNYTYHGQSW
ncbi:MAG: hypothetical protein Fues2KO_41680 [Fuerstiella sp.]